MHLIIFQISQSSKNFNQRFELHIHFLIYPRFVFRRLHFPNKSQGIPKCSYSKFLGKKQKKSVSCGASEENMQIIVYLMDSMLHLRGTQIVWKSCSRTIARREYVGQ